MALSNGEKDEFRKMIREVTQEVVQEQFPKLLLDALEPFATSIQQQFMRIDEQFLTLNKRLDRIESRLDSIENLMDRIERNVSIGAVARAV